MTTEAVRQYLAVLWKRYQSLKSRFEKSQVIDEICRNLKRHRKSAIRLMTASAPPTLRRGLSQRGRSRYSYEDIATGWTESEAISSKDAALVKAALSRIEAMLPFALVGLYVDNGTEFINELVVEKFAKEGRQTPIAVERSRPYKKNDQAHVEQKNFTHVREIMGYDRISGDVTLRQMNTIYRTHWRELNNFFLPQSKLVEKTRIRSKLKRKMDDPKTPFERLLNWRGLDEEGRQRLTSQRDELNPFLLRGRLTGALNRLRRHLKDEWSEPYQGRFHDKVS